MSSSSAGAADTARLRAHWAHGPSKPLDSDGGKGTGIEAKASSSLLELRPSPCPNQLPRCGSPAVHDGEDVTPSATSHLPSVIGYLPLVADRVRVAGWVESKMHRDGPGGIGRQRIGTLQRDVQGDGHGQRCGGSGALSCRARRRHRWLCGDTPCPHGGEHNQQDQ